MYYILQDTDTIELGDEWNMREDIQEWFPCKASIGCSVGRFGIGLNNWQVRRCIRKTSKGNEL